MDIFEYKKNRMLPFQIDKMNLYKKEAEILDLIEDRILGEGDGVTVNAKVIIYDIDFFNNFCDRCYDFVDTEYNISYTHLNLDRIDDRNTKTINIEIYDDDSEYTFTIESYGERTFPENRVDILDEDIIDKISGEYSDKYYLEINFYSLYLYMNKKAAQSIWESLNVAAATIKELKIFDTSFNDVKGEFFNMHDLGQNYYSSEKIELIKEFTNR